MEGDMSYHDNKKERQRRRKQLVEGKCDFCDNLADVPYKGDKYCFKCWGVLMEALRKKEVE